VGTELGTIHQRAFVDDRTHPGRDEARAMTVSVYFFVPDAIIGLPRLHGRPIESVPPGSRWRNASVPRPAVELRALALNRPEMRSGTNIPFHRMLACPNEKKRLAKNRRTLTISF
jgi:hypothetical protein